MKTVELFSKFQYSKILEENFEFFIILFNLGNSLLNLASILPPLGNRDPPPVTRTKAMIAKSNRKSPVLKFPLNLYHIMHIELL